MPTSQFILAGDSALVPVVAETTPLESIKGVSRGPFKTTLRPADYPLVLVSLPFCMSCGTQLPDEAKFCKKCGTPVGLLADDGPPRPALSDDSKAILKRARELLLHAQPKEAMTLLTEAATSDPTLHDNPAHGK